MTATPEWVAARILRKAEKGENTKWDRDLAHHFWGSARLQAALAKVTAEADHVPF